MAKKKTTSILIGIGVAALTAVGIAFASKLKPKINVSITANPSTGNAPLQVTFTATASEGTAPYSYAWDFGDGNVSNLQNPVNTYLTTGNYTANITVTDAGGKQANKSIAIIVTELLEEATIILTSEPSGATIYRGAIDMFRVTPTTFTRPVAEDTDWTLKLGGYEDDTFRVTVGLGETKTYPRVLIPVISAQITNVSVS